MSQETQPEGVIFYQMSVRYATLNSVQVSGGVRVLLDLPNKTGYVQIISLANEVYASHFVNSMSFLPPSSAAGVAWSAIPWVPDGGQASGANSRQSVSRAPSAGEVPRRSFSQNTKVDTTQAVFWDPNDAQRFKTVLDAIGTAFSDLSKQRAPLNLVPDFNLGAGVNLFPASPQATFQTSQQEPYGYPKMNGGLNGFQGNVYQGGQPIGNRGVNGGMNNFMNSGMNNSGMNAGIMAGMNTGMNAGMNTGMNTGMNSGFNTGMNGFPANTYEQPNNSNVYSTRPSEYGFKEGNVVNGSYRSLLNKMPNRVQSVRPQYMPPSMRPPLSVPQIRSESVSPQPNSRPQSAMNIAEDMGYDEPTGFEGGISESTHPSQLENESNAWTFKNAAQSDPYAFKTAATGQVPGEDPYTFVSDRILFTAPACMVYLQNKKEWREIYRGTLKVLQRSVGNQQQFSMVMERNEGDICQYHRILHTMDFNRTCLTQFGFTFATETKSRRCGVTRVTGASNALEDWLLSFKSKSIHEQFKRVIDEVLRCLRLLNPPPEDIGDSGCCESRICDTCPPKPDTHVCSVYERNYCHTW